MSSAYGPAPVLPAEDAPHVPLRAIWLTVAIVAAIYVALFLSGIRFFVFKTAILPVILAYGLLVRQRVAFMMDWLPLVSVTLLFDAVRGAIWNMIVAGYQVFYLDYVVALELAIFGTPAVPLQAQLLRAPALDLAAVLIHASHFAFFLLFGLVLWHARRNHFQQFRRALVLVMLFGLIGYAVIPTVPPWMAALPRFDFIPPVVHITQGLYTHYVSELYGSFATNPVAAMPSLHVAFPMVCALIGWRAYGRRIGAALTLYALAVMFVVIYLGEHYAVDVIAGVVVAGLAVYLGDRMKTLGLSFRASLVVSALLIALTAALAIFTPLIPYATF
jgi:membrane-associated phospholipid phosphatase